MDATVLSKVTREIQKKNGRCDIYRFCPEAPRSLTSIVSRSPSYVYVNLTDDVRGAAGKVSCMAKKDNCGALQHFIISFEDLLGFLACEGTQ